MGCSIPVDQLINEARPSGESPVVNSPKKAQASRAAFSLEQQQVPRRTRELDPTTCRPVVRRRTRVSGAHFYARPRSAHLQAQRGRWVVSIFFCVYGRGHRGSETVPRDSATSARNPVAASHNVAVGTGRLVPRDAVVAE